MDFIDLKSQYRRIEHDVLPRIQRVLAGGQMVNGPEVPELEQKLAAMAGARSCVCCANGTDALIMTMMARGIGPGHAVFQPAFTFVAAAEVTRLLGATPVFVDVDPVTYCMDPRDLELRIAETASARGCDGTPLKLSAVVAVDLYGQPADYAALAPICDRHGMVLVADAAQSFGARSGVGPVGSLAPLTTTSFYPAKPLGSYGEGGAVFVMHDDDAQVLRSIREHGMGQARYEHVRVGLNARLHTLQAAVLLSKLEIFADEIRARDLIAKRYSAGLAGVVTTPVLAPGNTSVWAQYTIQVDKRDSVIAALKSRGVPSAVHYPLPIHQQPAFRTALTRGCPVAERLSSRVLSLPMHPYLSEKDQDSVIAAVRDAVNG